MIKVIHLLEGDVSYEHRRKASESWFFYLINFLPNPLKEYRKQDLLLDSNSVYVIIFRSLPSLYLIKFSKYSTAGSKPCVRFIS